MSSGIWQENPYAAPKAVDIALNTAQGLGKIAQTNSSIPLLQAQANIAQSQAKQEAFFAAHPAMKATSPTVQEIAFLNYLGSLQNPAGLGVSQPSIGTSQQGLGVPQPSIGNTQQGLGISQGQMPQSSQNIPQQGSGNPNSQGLTSAQQSMQGMGTQPNSYVPPSPYGISNPILNYLQPTGDNPDLDRAKAIVAMPFITQQARNAYFIARAQQAIINRMPDDYKKNEIAKFAGAGVDPQGALSYMQNGISFDQYAKANNINPNNIQPKYAPQSSTIQNAQTKTGALAEMNTIGNFMDNAQAQYKGPKGTMQQGEDLVAQYSNNPAVSGPAIDRIAKYYASQAISVEYFGALRAKIANSNGQIGIETINEFRNQALVSLHNRFSSVVGPAAFLKAQNYINQLTNQMYGAYNRGIYTGNVNPPNSQSSNNNMVSSQPANNQPTTNQPTTNNAVELEMRKRGFLK